MKHPMVTVLMAVYNGERYVRKAIESILEQTFSDFEFLIVDDGSSDGSGEILRAYPDARIRVLTNAGNMGLSASLNRGLELSRGDYVARIDADDVSLPMRLQAQVKFLDTHSDIVLVGSKYETINASGHSMERVKVLTHPSAIRFCLLFDNPICHSSVMFRRRMVIEAGGYDPRVEVGQDFDLWNRLVYMGGITQIPETLVQLRLHRASVSRSSSSSVKSQYVLTVIQNVQRLTGRKIPFDVAESLFGQSTRKSFDPSAVRQAHKVMGDCLVILMKNEVNSYKSRFQLLCQALKKLEHIGRLSPNSFFRALRTGVWLALQHSPTAIFSPEFIRFAWRMGLPESLREHFQPYCPSWLRSK